jgi:hypothetical protein
VSVRTLCLFYPRFLPKICRNLQFCRTTLQTCSIACHRNASHSHTVPTSHILRPAPIWVNNVEQAFRKSLHCHGHWWRHRS